MRYTTYALANSLAKPLTWTLQGMAHIAEEVMEPIHGTPIHGLTKASIELPLRILQPYQKQPYGLSIEDENGEELYIKKEVVYSKPFCDLVRFPYQEDKDQPNILIVAALSGHYATLLRDTVQSFLPDNHVYLTDWKNARDVPLSEGRFGFDEYVTYLLDFIEELGPNTHIVATCQSTVQALIATAVLAETNPKLNPATLTLMAGPVDTRINPNFINKLGGKVKTDLLRKTHILKVPKGYKGAGRRVYPGFYQLGGFMSLNITTHLKKHVQFFKDVMSHDEHAAEKHREFYDEYYTVLDATEEFFIETLDRVFIEHHIPRGVATYNGNPVDFSKIKKTALLTLEGEADDLCPPGQTSAAHDICTAIPKSKRHTHVHPSVGHYGIFSGSRWREGIYPVIQKFIDKHGA